MGTAEPGNEALLPLPPEEGNTFCLTNFCPPFQNLLSERLTSLGIMGEPRVPPLNPSESIVF